MLHSTLPEDGTPFTAASTILVLGKLGKDVVKDGTGLYILIYGYSWLLMLKLCHVSQDSGQFCVCQAVPRHPLEPMSSRNISGGDG